MIIDRIQHWLIQYLDRVHSARWLRWLKKHFPRIYWTFDLILTFIIPPLFATALLLLNWIVDLAGTTQPKLWFIPLGVFLIALMANYFIIKRCRPVRFDESPKVLICAPIPTTDDEDTDVTKRLGIMGDICLQLAGFQVGKTLYGKQIDIQPFSTAARGWQERLRQTLKEMFNDGTRPIWIVVTMSRKMSEVMKIVNIWLATDNHLKIGRTTVIFTVTSSDFVTTDRRTMFRLFVDGKREAHCISERITAINHHSGTPIKSVLCAVTNSIYGRQAARHLQKRLQRTGVESQTGLISEDGITGIDDDKDSANLVETSLIPQDQLRNYQAVILFAYERDLKSIFCHLKAANFKGHIIGATTLSVGDWQNIVKEAVVGWSNRPPIYHTAVVGFDERSDATDKFIEEIAKLKGKEILSSPQWHTDLCEIDEALKLQFVTSADYKHYDKISINYISAFCAEAMRLFALMKAKEKGTLRALLDDESAADELKSQALIKDVDFGIIGESHVGLTIEVWNLNSDQLRESRSESQLESPQPEETILATDSGYVAELKPVRRRALVIVDLQNDFFENGTLPVDGAVGLLPGINESIAAAEKAGWLVVFTRDRHPEKHSSFIPQGGEWPPHCVADSKGAALHSDLLVPPTAIIVSKGESVEGMGYSPFDSDEFLSTLKKLGVKQIVVAGVALEYCVKATCKDARARGYDVIAIKNLVSSVSSDAKIIEENWNEIQSSGVTLVSDFSEIQRKRPTTGLPVMGL